MKSNLGISIGLLSAIMYGVAYFGGYIPLLVLVGYVLLVEPNDWLKYVAVKALCLNFMFSVLSVVITFIPEVLSVIQSFIYLFNGSFSYSLIIKIQSLLLEILTVGKILLYALLAYKAMSLSDVAVGPVDSMIKKHMKNEA